MTSEEAVSEGPVGSQPWVVRAWPRAAAWRLGPWWQPVGLRGAVSEGPGPPGGVPRPIPSPCRYGSRPTQRQRRRANSHTAGRARTSAIEKPSAHPCRPLTHRSPRPWEQSTRDPTRGPVGPVSGAVDSARQGRGRNHWPGGRRPPKQGRARCPAIPPEKPGPARASQSVPDSIAAWSSVSEAAAAASASSLPAAMATAPPGASSPIRPLHGRS